MKMNIHLFSPFLYIIFVETIKIFKPIPSSTIMLEYRKYHNICLSILSLLMLIGITYGNYVTNKFSSVNNLLCLTYNNNYFALTSAKFFLYSKYLEWGDTSFLHLSDKKISNLHYTHHMTTALLMYLNQADYLSPSMFIFMGLNCFIHIFMYWYFAFPKGILKKIRKQITQIQIIQHIICISTIIYTMNLDNCKHNNYGNESALLLYLMYLFYFIIFYIQSYKKKNKE